MTDQMENASEEGRYRQVLALDVEQPTSLEALVEALYDDGWRVRRAAAEQLGKTPRGEFTARRLVAVLHQRGETGARNAAADALIRLGPAAVPHVLALLDEGDPDARKFGADILGSIARPEAASRLIAALEDSDSNVRLAAAEALGRIGGEEAIRALEQLLRSKETLLQVAALEALAQLEISPPLPLVAPLVEDAPLRRSALRVLGLIPQAAACERVCRYLADPVRAHREVAIAALGRQYTRATPAIGASLLAIVRAALRAAPDSDALLRNALEAEELDVRVGALIAARALKEDTLAETVAEAAQDPALASEVVSTLIALGPRAGRRLVENMETLSLPAQAAAGEALISLAEPSFVPGLTELLRQSEDPTVRLLAVRALGASQSAEAVSPLVTHLTEPDLAAPTVRALVSLAGSFRETAVSALERAVGRGASVALAALARVDRRAALVVLKRTVRDADPHLRAAAVEAAGELEADACQEISRLALSDESARVRRAGLRALARCGDPGAEPLLRRGLSDEEREVRLAAVEATGTCRTEALAEELGALIAQEDGELAATAVRALATMGRFGPAPLEAAAHHVDPEVIKEGLEAGAAMPEAVCLALEHLRHPRWDVRVAAARVLASSGDRAAVNRVREALAEEQDELARQALEEALAQLERR